jgi:arylsulfatase A-like enzyme
VNRFLLKLVCRGFLALAASAASARPNIVVILADDQGWGDLSVNGNTQLATPHIDSLARDGATFERFFVCPVCSPTRAEFLTGRYHPRGGVRGVSTGQERLDLDETTIAQVFQAAGYATGCFGKWHNGSQWPYHPLARGFDEYFGFTSGHWGEYFDPPLEDNGKFIRAKGYIADIFTDRAIDFIQRHRDRPFFCYLAYNTPHSPYAVPQEYWLKHKDQPITLRGAAVANESVDETRCVLAMCENLDFNVGRVLARLEELKLAEDTIVFYFSDNGPNTVRWNGGMKGRKGTTDEGGLRVPALMRWPAKIKPGLIIGEIAGAIDLLPTLAGLADVPLAVDRPLDGRDLSPLLLGTTKDWPDRMLFSHWAGRVSVRTQRHRLDEAGALFDMVSDHGQTKDISKEQPEVAARLSQAVAAWRKEMFDGALQPLPAKAKGKAKASLVPLDDRPFPVGFRKFPLSPLPARDGVPHGNIRRSAPAPNCSYFVNWTASDDFITWDIEVHTAGEYDVQIYYTCPEADAGSTIELSFQGSRLAGKVAPGWDPLLYTNQDTIPRPAAESKMKEFRPLRLGSMRLETGRGLLTLRATQIPGKSVMDVRLVTLRLLSP